MAVEKQKLHVVTDLDSTIFELVALHALSYLRLLEIKFGKEMRKTLVDIRHAEHLSLIHISEPTRPY